MNMSRFPTLTRTARRPLLSLVSALALGACAQFGGADLPGTSDDGATLLRIAASTRAAGDARAAIPLYRRAHALAPGDPEPLIELGRTLHALGADREAIEVWAQALKLRPDDPAILTGFAVSQLALGQPHLALEKLERANRLAPTPASHNALGVAHDMLGQATRAQASYRAGLKLAPNDMRLSSNLALSLALSGSHGAAIDRLEAVVQRAGATRRHRQNLALVYALAGFDDLAVRLAQVDLDPASAQRNLAHAAIIRGLPTHAEKVASVGALRRASSG